MIIKKVACLFLPALVLLVAVLSCSEKKQKPPISLDEMQLLLLDLHLAESYSVGLYPDSLKKKFDKNPDSLAVYYAAVFRHHNINADEFKEVMDWYKQHPDMLDSLYNRVLDKANELQAEQDKKEAAAGKTNIKNDSLSSKPGLDTTYVKRQRDSLRQNRRTFRKDTLAYPVKL